MRDSRSATQYLEDMLEATEGIPRARSLGWDGF